ncbi:Thiolase-like protein [Pseudocohnilembus persalinus]|uniref:beta-ketoacyl-[acyl-carrier-protein] synthase I n=1 Tax=Pseudocohnilembus persalinus TaxID=266149 RepID=A0A0V0R235_PSEPJ|nr:Thiolase-like protein [Pseudocohnilembus persalinus]|eukprot:KRX08585.1 Thiolase-like protein [Pseudocohnilembus persalinus]
MIKFNYKSLSKFSTNYTKKTKQLNRVVITGLGSVNPLGLNVENSYQRFKNMESGIISIKSRQEYKDNPQYPDVYMAPVFEGFDTKKYKVAFSTNNTNMYTMSAVEEALQDSNLIQLLQENDQLREKCGVNIGTMSSNITKMTDILLDAGQKGFEKLNRMTILHILANMPAANVSIKYKLNGPSNTSSTACATGASSIGDSFRQIQMGTADIMIAGSSEDSISPTNIHGSLKLQAMSSKKWASAGQSSRPFDQQRSGFILGEGSGVLILEELSHALNRNAKIYCELTGYGQSSDGYHLTRPLEDGTWALKSMQNALKDADIPVEDLDHVNCHATSTQAGDTAEANAIQNLLKNNQDLLKKVTISAIKSQIGHTFGAAGSIETIFLIKSMEEGLAPGIKNLENPIEGYQLNFNKEQMKKQEINNVIKNAFGFGGVNTSLLFSKFKL